MDILIHISLMLTFLIPCYGAEEISNVQRNDIIEFLYNQYREAVAENKSVASRRVFINDVEYQMHVNKLRDVNGLKLHNLVLRTGDQPNINKTIYINNPLESKLPQAFLSLDEFKKTLTDRVQKQKDEVKEDNLKAKVNEEKMHENKTTLKPRSPRTIFFIRAPDYPDMINHTQGNESNKTNAKPASEVSVATKIENVTTNITEKTTTKDKTKTTENIYIHYLLPNKNNSNSTESTTISTTKVLILGGLENTTTDHTITTTKNDNGNSESTTMTEPKLNTETETARDSKENNTESTVSSKNDTTEAVTNGDVTKTSELETTTTTTTIMETVMTESVTEVPTTTTMSPRATLGRPAVYIGR